MKSLFDFLSRSSKQKNAVDLQTANDLYEQKKFAEAARLYQRILKRDSTHFAALANLAVSYFELENFQKAEPLFRSLTETDSFNPWWFNYLSQCCQKNGNFKIALEAGWQAVVISGGAKEHHLNLAYTIYEIADEKGREYVDSFLKKWHRQYPDSGIVRQCYKSFYNDTGFTCSDPEYIENLFDIFAPDFDAVLADLNYSSPRDVADFLVYFFSKKKSGKKRILDLGCGSGLCGRQIAEKISDAAIFGVDISSEMLAEARQKNVYEKLLKSDINDCFSKVKSKFDAVVAADVLTYFGRLDSVFKSIADSLKKSGAFVFTFSLNQINKKEFFLMPSSRFVHSAQYVQSVLEKSGFLIIKKDEKSLRKEGNKDVIGMVVLAVKK